MEDLDAQLRAMSEKFADRTVQGNYALWNALLTMDAIFITVFTAGLAYVEQSVQWFLLPTILLSIISAGLLIANFRATRDNMKYHGLLAGGRVFEMSEEEKVADITRAVSTHDRMSRREGAVYFITFVQGLFIVALVLYVAFLRHPTI
jgi:hypothetical protein